MPRNLRAGRPCKHRKIKYDHSAYYFKPRAVPLCELEETELLVEEIEALRLKNIEELDQVECAEKMHVSQSTFQRILTNAYKKISKALINGQAIKINNNPPK